MGRDRAGWYKVGVGLIEGKFWVDIRLVEVGLGFV